MLQNGKASLRDHDEQGMPLLHVRESDMGPHNLY